MRGIALIALPVSHISRGCDVMDDSLKCQQCLRHPAMYNVHFIAVSGRILWVLALCPSCAVVKLLTHLEPGCRIQAGCQMQFRLRGAR